jgi:hypothetical protein
VGLARCSICGSAHESPAGHLCPRCAESVDRRETETLEARNLEAISARFGPFVKKDPERIAAAVERRNAHLL